MLKEDIAKTVNDNVNVAPTSACESVTCECDVRRFSLNAMVQTRKHALAATALIDTICSQSDSWCPCSAVTDYKGYRFVVIF